jgi:hypothetical protein
MMRIARRRPLIALCLAVLCGCGSPDRAAEETAISESASIEASASADTPAAVSAPPSERDSAAQDSAARTPPQGSAERKAILDAMRAERARFDTLPVVFVVRHLKVRGGWAWLEADPQSPDGSQRYEGEAALLRSQGGAWTVVERMPAFSEREGTPLEEDCAYFADLRRRNPGLPIDVLPPESRAPCPSAPSS